MSSLPRDMLFQSFRDKNAIQVCFLSFLLCCVSRFCVHVCVCHFCLQLSESLFVSSFSRCQRLTLQSEKRPICRKCAHEWKNTRKSGKILQKNGQSFAKENRKCVPKSRLFAKRKGVLILQGVTPTRNWEKKTLKHPKSQIAWGPALCGWLLP